MKMMLAKEGKATPRKFDKGKSTLTLTVGVFLVSCEAALERSCFAFAPYERHP
jgi:hypothetical protein